MDRFVVKKKPNVAQVADFEEAKLRRPNSKQFGDMYVYQGRERLALQVCYK